MKLSLGGIAMWPIFIGFVFGMAVHVAYHFLRHRLAHLGDDPLVRKIVDPRGVTLTELLWGLAWTVLLLIGVVVLPATIGFESVAKYRDWLWIIFHHTTAGSFFLGGAAGFLSASWYRDSRTHESPNLSVRGIAVGSFVAIVIVFGLNNEHRIFDRVSKFSASVVSIELDRGQRPEVENTAPPGSATAIWAADENIGFALLIAEDLANKALDRDRQALQQVMSVTPNVLFEENRTLLKEHILPLVELRKDIHAAKRDTSPIYFDTDRLDQIKLALALRELIFADMRRESGFDASRDHLLVALARAYGNYFASTHRSSCLFVKPAGIAQLEKEGDALTVAVGKLSGESKERKILELAGVRARLAEALREEEDRCKLVSDIAVHMKFADDAAKAFKDAIPPKSTVQSSPYVAIIAATFLLGGGEREAAISILDQWRRIAAQHGEGSPEKTAQGRVFSVRVLNLIGLLLSNRSNPVHMELNWHYQQMALDTSDAFIESNSPLKYYARKHKFTDGKNYDVVSAAAHPASDRRNECDDDRSLTNGARYFVLRRSTLLNNAVYFLAMQHDLLEQPEMGDRFNGMVEELRSIRVDCLANLAADKFLVGVEWRELRAKRLSDNLETLARALKTQAWLRRADGKAARQSICDAYRAALYSERLSLGAGDRPLSRQDILDKSFAENGAVLAEFSNGRNIKKLVRELQLKIQSQGEGACSGIVDEVIVDVRR